MKIQDIDALERIIDRWDGEVVIDAYNLEPSHGVAVISLTKRGKVVNAINFEGEHSDLLILFTEILRKHINKIVEEQRDKIVEFRD